MESAVQHARKAPRGWLWLARAAIAFFFITTLLMAVAILLLFLESASGHWHEWRTIFWFAVCVAAFSCGLTPYILVVWNHWREKTRAKGLFEALIIGTFWFFAGWIVPSDSAFHGIPAFSSTGMSGNYSDFLEVSLGIFLGCALPALLLLISGMKLVNFRSNLPPVDAAPDPGKHTFVLRAGVGTTMVLLLLPAAFGFFTLRQGVPILQLAVIEAMLLVPAFPYALVWRNLRNGKLNSSARKTASALATGVVALFATGGVTYGFISWGNPSSRPHQMSTWAEIVFFVLLGLANLAVLLAGRTYARESEEAGDEKRFARGALAISLCLGVFGFFIMLASASA
jgi:hypothetical protein